MKMSSKHLAPAAALLWVLTGCAGDEKEDGDANATSVWPSYGHDGKNTRFNAEETAITRDNVSKLVKKWDSVSVGTTHWGVTSTVAVTDGVAYFGDWGGMLFAVDAKTGKKVWRTQLAPATTGLSAQLNASPFVSEDRVYLGGVDNAVYSVDRKTGEPIWKPSALAGNQSSVILWSSPNVVDNTLLIGVGSFEVFTGAPGAYTFRGNLVMMDATSGAVQHTTYVTNGDDTSGYGCSIWGSAAIDTDRKTAYVGVGQSYSAPASTLSDSVIAVDYTTGELKWGYQFTMNDIWTASAGNGEDWDVGASVVLYEVNGQPLVGAGDKGGHFYALNRDTGTLVWGTELTPGGRTGGVMASPAVADGVIYVYSNDGIAENFGSDGPTAGSAFAIDGATGNHIWETKFQQGAFGGIAVANGLMFFTTLDGSIHALNTENGQELWTDKLLGGMATESAGGVTVAGGMVYAGAGWDWAPLADPPPGGVTAYALPEK
ncbi:MAG: PQQ-binding-like beta-propeller repeat protein [Myxococcales bacterium]